MAEQSIAQIYADALLDIGIENNCVDSFLEELNAVNSLYLTDAELNQYLTSPIFVKEQKKDFIDKVFSQNFSKDIVSFFKVLIDNSRIELLPDVATAYQNLRDKREFVLKVQAFTAISLSPEATKELEEKLSKKFTKKVLIENVIDESILGGIIIKVGDTVYDGSLVKDFRKIKSNIINRKIRGEVIYED